MKKKQTKEKALHLIGFPAFYPLDFNPGLKEWTEKEYKKRNSNKNIKNKDREKC